MATARELANLALMWDDAVTEISGVVIASHSTEVSGYPAENLLDANRQNVFQSSVTAPTDAYIEFDLLSDVTIKGLAICNHNAETIGADSLTVKTHTSAQGAGATTTWFSVNTSAFGDDDFFCVPANNVTGRYVRVTLDNPDSSGTQIGRVFLARSIYDCGTSLRVGAQKGWRSSVEIMETPGGVEHRFSRGSRRKRLSAVIPNQSGIATIRTQINNLVQHVEVAEKAFIHSWPYGATLGVQSLNSLFGMAVHARFFGDEYMETLQVAQGLEIPFNTIEVL